MVQIRLLAPALQNHVYYAGTMLYAFAHLYSIIMLKNYACIRNRLRPNHAWSVIVYTYIIWLYTCHTWLALFHAISNISVMVSMQPSL